MLYIYIWWLFVDTILVKDLVLGYNAGQYADIICSDGSNCQDLEFYCYSAAKCKYECSSCSTANPILIGDVDFGLTDPLIHQIYLDNHDQQKKKDKLLDNNHDDHCINNKNN